jgi:hypothetical protein
MRTGGVNLERRAPLLRFSGPFSVLWPRRVLASTGRPARRTFPASALPRDTRAFRADRVAKLALAGLRFRSRTRRGGARCGGRAGVGVRPDREERVVRPPGRRPVAGSRRRCDRAVRGRPVNPVRVAPTADPTTRERRRLASAAHRPGHAPPRFLARCSATRRSWAATRGLVGRAGPSLDPSDGAHGVPFDRALRRFAPAHRWCARFRATGPACRSCRLVRPIYFRRVTGCSRVSDPDEARRPGMRWRRLPGFAPMCDPHPPLATAGAILPWALPLAGLAGTSFRASGRARPRPDHQPPGMSRRSTAVPRSPIRSWVSAPFPSRHARPAVRREPPALRGP